MAKFLQETLDNMSVSGKGHTCESAKEFAEFFAKVCIEHNFLVHYNSIDFILGETRRCSNIS